MINNIRSVTFRGDCWLVNNRYLIFSDQKVKDLLKRKIPKGIWELAKLIEKIKIDKLQQVAKLCQKN